VRYGQFRCVKAVGAGSGSVRRGAVCRVAVGHGGRGKAGYGSVRWVKAV